MEKNEILVIYGTDYIGMTKEILEEADLAGQIFEPVLLQILKQSFQHFRMGRRAL